MKHYYIKHAEYIISEGKSRASESDHQKAVDSPLKKENEKRLKNIEKTVDKVSPFMISYPYCIIAKCL